MFDMFDMFDIGTRDTGLGTARSGRRPDFFVNIWPKTFFFIKFAFKTHSKYLKTIMIDVKQSKYIFHYP